MANTNINIDLKLEELDYPTFYTKNTLIKYYISKSFTGLDLTDLPVPKINVIYLDDQQFSNKMAISFNCKYKNNKTKLILDEIIHLYNVCKETRVDYTNNNINEYIKPFGLELPSSSDKLEIDPGNIYYKMCKIILNNDEKKEDISLIKLYNYIYKYIFYIFSNITDSINIDIEYYADQMRVISYYDINGSSRVSNLPTKLQNIVDKTTLEFIEFPFLIDLVDCITIYQPKSSDMNVNFTLINDNSCINNNTKLINITDTYSALYSYAFTENFKDYILYSNPNISCNLIVDSGYKGNTTNRLASASSKTIDSIFIGQYLSDYAKIFCRLDLSGKGSPQLKTELPKSKDIVNLEDVQLINLDRYIYNPLIWDNHNPFVKEGNNDFSEKSDNNYDESGINKWNWEADNESTNIEENKTRIENSQNEDTKVDKISTKLASELGQLGWFFQSQNSIPNCNHNKKENSYKDLYSEVTFENFMGKLENIENEYGDLVNFPEYEITVDINNFNPIDLYPDLRTFPQKYIHGLKRDINKSTLSKLVAQLNQVSDDFQYKLENSEEYLTYKNRGFQELFHIIEVSSDDLKNKVNYSNTNEIYDDIFHLSIGYPDNTNIYKAYKEIFYQLNIYNGEVITINGVEINNDLTLHMFNENKYNKMQEIIENIKKSSNIWAMEYINLNENINKFQDQNGYLQIEQIKNSIIDKFLKII